jgi:hypothetical protein
MLATICYQGGNVCRLKNQDLYSIDQSLLNFSRNYEPNKNVSSGHSTSSSHSVSESSPKAVNNPVKKK